MDYSRIRFYILLGIFVYSWASVCPLAAVQSSSVPTRPDPEIMRKAMHHTLNLEFNAALAEVDRLKNTTQPTLGSRLLRGMIAYFQVRWQSPQSTPARDKGHQALTAILAAAETYLTPLDTASAQPTPWLQTALGLAAVFDALLQQSTDTWQSMQRLIQGRAWLKQARLNSSDHTEADFGLGLAAIVANKMPSSLRLIWRQTTSHSLEYQAQHHLQLAAETSWYGRDLARTFLLQLYELEQAYTEAIELGQTLQNTFPNNGYYKLRIGLSQCENGQHTVCARTLGHLAKQLTTAPDQLIQRDDRFDLYYIWGTALNHIEQYNQAFKAFRQAISQDPSASSDNTLWANLHLARLYERRDQFKTARQLYRTILRRRNVDDIHTQARQRLDNLQ